MQRMTRQRTAIRDALQANDHFVSAQELHTYLTNDGHNIGLATVYRNLQDLAASDEVDVLRVEGSDTQLFRYCGNDQHHHHLVCRSCGATQEIEIDMLESWAHKTAAEHGFTDVSHSLELYGLCARCSQAQTL